jgi:hypothetical protein
MAMSKKDYVLIAGAIDRTSTLINADKHTIHMVVMHLSHALEQDNPRFDSERFIDACLTYYKEK